MNTRLIILLAALAILSSGLLIYTLTGSDGSLVQKKLEPDNREFVELGQRIYVENCAACHGANLEGEGDWRQRKPSGRLPAPPHDETGHTWHHPDQALFDLTKYGPQHVAGPEYESDMPAFDGVLSDGEIIAVLSYIKSSWDEKTRAIHDELNRRMTPE